MKQYIVDAFTEELFHGNQAAVCVLDRWLPEMLMMQIAKENNFSETAFTVKTGDGYDLRWFTPGAEIQLCGHATLATSYVLFHFYETAAEQIVFHTMSGDLFIRSDSDYIVMDFPALKCSKIAVTEEMSEALGAVPAEAYLDDRLLLVYEDEKTVRNVKPDFDKVALLDEHGVAITAPGKGYDCVSRYFAPRLKVNEDPVTGSAHCMITPYWSERLGKKEIHAYQASERGGTLRCRMEGERVFLAGKAVLFSVCDLQIGECG